MHNSCSTNTEYTEIKTHSPLALPAVQSLPFCQLHLVLCAPLLLVKEVSDAPLADYAQQCLHGLHASVRLIQLFAGIRCMTIETERAWHARQLVSELSLQELESYDGIVAVSFVQSVLLTPGCAACLLSCICCLEGKM